MASDYYRLMHQVEGSRQIRYDVVAIYGRGIWSVGIRGKAFFIICHTLPRLMMTVAPSSTIFRTVAMQRFVSTVTILTGAEIML